MRSVEIPEPVEGWNPVPGDPDSMVWWDGSAFTAEAIRAGDGWEICADDGRTDDPGRFVASAPEPPVRLRTWRWVTITWFLVVVGLLVGELFALGSAGPTSNAPGCPGWDGDPEPMLSLARILQVVLFVVVAAGFVIGWLFSRRTGMHPAKDRVVLLLRIAIGVAPIAAIVLYAVSFIALIFVAMDCGL